MKYTVDCAGRLLDLSSPVVMGILNVTPDSFSDGGRFLERGKALEHARAMIGEGAAIIDVGGESSRPGAESVPVEQEMERVIPVIEVLASQTDAVISIDTTKPEVMQAAVVAGAGLINDINALRADGALQVAADSGAAVCLMHMQGRPQNMQENPRYADVVTEVREFLADRLQEARDAGIDDSRLMVDPGFGFGKTLAHNLHLVRELVRIVELDVPVLVGVSRKSMIGAVLDVPPGKRGSGGLGLEAVALWQGASVIRTHDVAATVDMLKMVTAVRDSEVME